MSRSIRGFAISVVAFGAFGALLLLMDAAIFSLLGLSLVYRG